MLVEIDHREGRQTTRGPWETRVLVPVDDMSPSNTRLNPALALMNVCIDLLTCDVRLCS